MPTTTDQSGTLRPRVEALAPQQALPLVRVSVDNNHCHLYAICQQEAPAVFDLGVDGRLRYDTSPGGEHTAAVRQAARCCPTQAIILGESS